MAAKKKSSEHEWKIAAADRLVAEARAAGAPAEKIAEFKKLKRRPSQLLTLAFLLRDKEGVARIRQFPRGSEAVVAALDAEEGRLIAEYGSVDAYFALQDGQRRKAALARGKSDDETKGRPSTGTIVAALAKEHAPSIPPGQLWATFGAKLLEAFAGCDTLTGDAGGSFRFESYRYPYWSGTRETSRTISYRQFRELLGRERRMRLSSRRVAPKKKSRD